jgi:hypothetical protein
MDPESVSCAGDNSFELLAAVGATEIGQIDGLPSLSSNLNRTSLKWSESNPDHRIRLGANSYLSGTFTFHEEIFERPRRS